MGSLHTGSSSLLQETFDAGLQAFQQEGIANITALKDQLLAAKHIQSKAIEARHASLMKRWSQLLANSATRKKKLLEAQSHFRKVRVGPDQALLAHGGTADPTSSAVPGHCPGRKLPSATAVPAAGRRGKGGESSGRPGARAQELPHSSSTRLTRSPLLPGGGPLPHLCQKGISLQQLV